MQYVAYSIDVAYSISCRYAFVTIPVDNFISQKVNIWSQAGARFALVWQYIYEEKMCFFCNSKMKRNSKKYADNLISFLYTRHYRTVIGCRSHITYALIEMILQSRESGLNVYTSPTAQSSGSLFRSSHTSWLPYVRPATFLSHLSRVIPPFISLGKKKPITSPTFTLICSSCGISNFRTLWFFELFTTFWPTSSKL